MFVQVFWILEAGERWLAFFASSTSTYVCVRLGGGGGASSGVYGVWERETWTYMTTS